MLEKLYQKYLNWRLNQVKRKIRNMDGEINNYTSNAMNGHYISSTEEGNIMNDTFRKFFALEVKRNKLELKLVK